MNAHLAVSAVALALCACASTSPRPLARVNGELVTGQELRQEFGRSHRSMEKVLGTESEVRKYLARLVDRRLFVQEGYRMGIHDQAEVRTALVRFRAQKMVDAFLKEEIEEPARPTDEEVIAAYESLADVVEARTVALKTRADADAARAAVAGGADLEKLARERSVSPSAKRGGAIALRWGGDEARERALLASREGELTPVFESSAGWEFALVMRRRQTDRPPFEKVVGQVRATIERRKRAARQRELLERLWTKYDVNLAACLPTFEALEAAARSPALDDTICATWRGGALLAHEVVAAVKVSQLAESRTSYEKLRGELVEEVANRKLAALEAEARGYGARPEIVQAVKAQEESLVETALFNDWVVVDVTTTEADARAYHAAHPREFVHDALYELAQIVVDSAALAAEVKAKLDAGQPFEELARTYSKDKAGAAAGGHAGTVPRWTLSGPLAAIAALSKGEVSAPLELEGTFRIVKVLEVTPERPRPFEEVAEAAHAKVLQERKKAALDRWVAKLRDDAVIELDDRGIREYERERAAWLAEEERKTAEKKGAEEARRAALVARAKALPAPRKAETVAPQRPEDAAPAGPDAAPAGEAGALAAPPSTAAGGQK